MLSLSCTLILLTSVEAGAMVGVCAVVVVLSFLWPEFCIVGDMSGRRELGLQVVR